MSGAKRKVHEAEFKTKVGMEAIHGAKTINPIAQKRRRATLGDVVGKAQEIEGRRAFLAPARRSVAWHNCQSATGRFCLVRLLAQMQPAGRSASRKRTASSSWVKQSTKSSA